MLALPYWGVRPEILGDAGIALVDLRAVNNDVIGLCFLNLKRFVDQIAENLQAQPFLLLLFHLSAIGSADERQPLVDIRPRDDLPIDNGGGFADIGIADRKSVVKGKRGSGRVSL